MLKHDTKSGEFQTYFTQETGKKTWENFLSFNPSFAEDKSEGYLMVSEFYFILALDEWEKLPPFWVGLKLEKKENQELHVKRI